MEWKWVPDLPDDLEWVPDSPNDWEWNGTLGFGLMIRSCLDKRAGGFLVDVCA